MKRKGNLYKDVYNFENIISAFNEVCKNTKSSRKDMGTAKGLELSFNFHRICKIKYYVRYQDDFLLFHHSKEYLKYCLEKIRKFLESEKLFLNKKTRIYRDTNNFIFLGRDSNGKYARYRSVKRKLKKNLHLYKNKKINLSSMVSSIICYDSLCNKKKSTIYSPLKNSTKIYSSSPKSY